MRFTPCITFLLAACGTDVRTMTNDQDSLTDAGVGGSAHVVDAMPIPPDGIPPGLTPCEEAVYHSDLAWIQSNVFDVSCTDECHGKTPPSADLALTVGQAHAELVNVQSTEFPDWKRVVPGAPAQSMLMVQIGGEPGPELEGFMPWNQPRLCDEKIDAVRRWISAGAES